MTLAINGGTPVRTKSFLPWPYFDDGERTALLRALEQGQWWRMTGGEVSAFEAEFSQVHGSASTLAVSNGTHALQVALKAIGVGPGDEVIVPAFTFISTSTAVQDIGAIAVPADVNLHDFCIDPASVAERTTSRTRAVIPVHMAGHPVDMDGLAALCEPRGITILQDACHAHGMVYKGRRVGEWGSIACFSFQNFKLMTAGEGGAITFPSEELREKAFLHHNCGRSPTDKKYRHEVRGSNFRLGEFAASVLREQLKRLPAQNEKRDENAKILYKSLSSIEGVLIPSRAPNIDVHPHYMVMFRIDRRKLPNFDRDAAVQALVAEGIPAFRNYVPVYRTEAFWETKWTTTETSDYWRAHCPNSETLADDGIWIHHRVLLGDDRDVEDVATAVEKVFRALAEDC